MENKDLEEITVKATILKGRKIEIKNLPLIKRIGNRWYSFNLSGKDIYGNTSNTYDCDLASETQKVAFEMLDLMIKEGVYPETFKVSYSIKKKTE